MPIQTTIKSNALQVGTKVAAFADLFMGTMAAQIQSQMITGGTIPFYPKSHTSASGRTSVQRGALRSSIRMVRKGPADYAVTAGTGTVAAAYAASQEAGITRGHPIRKYTTPGTGPHWFQGAIDTVKSRANEYISQAKGAVGLD